MQQVDGEIDFGRYSDFELRESFQSIDKNVFPKNWAALNREIESREISFSLNNSDERLDDKTPVLSILVALAFVVFVNVAVLEFYPRNESPSDLLGFSLVNGITLAIVFWRLSTVPFLYKLGADVGSPVIWFVTIYFDLISDLFRAVRLSKQKQSRLPPGFYLHALSLSTFLVSFGIVLIK